MQDEYLQKLAEDLHNGTIEFYEDESEVSIGCVQCGSCCRNRNDILLTPFDLYNLVKATGKTIGEIFKKYTSTFIACNSHLPTVQLRYREEADGTTTCYFLGRKDGKSYCRVQEHKPCVCRIFPFGKCGVFEQEGVRMPVEKPKYFLQEDNGTCPGVRLAREHDQKVKLVDWVGGKEEKRLSEKYSKIFYDFADKYTSALQYEKTVKRVSQRTLEIFFRLSGNVMYAEYDFDVEPDVFLDQMERNMNFVTELARRMVEDPQMLLRIEKRANEMKKANATTNETA